MSEEKISIVYEDMTITYEPAKYDTQGRYTPDWFTIATLDRSEKKLDDTEVKRLIALVKLTGRTLL